jgi:hypothetical protein
MIGLPTFRFGTDARVIVLDPRATLPETSTGPFLTLKFELPSLEVKLIGPGIIV